MAVNYAVPCLRTYLVELVTERAHLGGIVLITRDDLVNGIDNDGVKVLIPHTSDEFRHKLVERHGMTSEVLDHDAVRVLYRKTEILVNLEETIDRACRINFKVHI